MRRVRAALCLVSRSVSAVSLSGGSPLAPRLARLVYSVRVQSRVNQLGDTACWVTYLTAAWRSCPPYRVPTAVVLFVRLGDVVFIYFFASRLVSASISSTLMLLFAPGVFFFFLRYGG